MMMDLSTQHAIKCFNTTSCLKRKEILASTNSRYDNCRNHGIIINTGAATISTAGLNQNLAYKKTFRSSNSNVDTTKGHQNSIKFGIRSTKINGIVEINTLLRKVEFFAVDSNTLFLLSLYDTDRPKIYFNNLENVIVQGNEAFPIVLKWGHPFLLEKKLASSKPFSSSTFSFYCFLSVQEIR